MGMRSVSEVSTKENRDTWPHSRVQNLLGIDLPILLAPMAGAALSELAIAVAEAGGLGALPCAMLSVDQVRTEVGKIRERTSCPINLNFFCHQQPSVAMKQEAAWRERLAPYYVELGIDLNLPFPSSSRRPFDEAMCDLVAELKPEVVSFHFGLPKNELLARSKATGAKILSSATTVAEARWLEDHGCDAIIAQGYEAGGHRGMFLTQNVSTQVGTMALVPQVVDAVKVPVIAAGGIADARGIVAALALGASAVQLGTAYLLCPEATIALVHRQALRNATDDQTVLTNVFSGRVARGIINRLIREVGPIADLAPPFPLASGAITPLRMKSEASGSEDFAQMWSGQSAHLCQELPARALTKQLAADTLAKLDALTSNRARDRQQHPADFPR
jgi:nitronate monooxygenase